MSSGVKNVIPLSCKCGSLNGFINCEDGINRCVCYCDDCQAFARFLNCKSEILDDNCGTEVVQVIQKNLKFTKGFEFLSCIRLSENGLLRWYASCCNTPVGNTPANYKISTIGLIRNFLDCDEKFLDQLSGPEKMYVYTRYAKGDAGAYGKGFFTGIYRAIFMVLKSVLRRDYRYSPLFTAGTGEPVSKPRVLSKQELSEIK